MWVSGCRAREGRVSRNAWNLEDRGRAWKGVHPLALEAQLPHNKTTAGLNGSSEQRLLRLAAPGAGCGLGGPESLRLCIPASLRSRREGPAHKDDGGQMKDKASLQAVLKPRRDPSTASPSPPCTGQSESCSDPTARPWGEVLLPSVGRTAGP